ncbi:carbohydrate kinase [Stieleria sp. TO1_6]|nr:carbohydrate kinase [Stieleria tagensis]
MISRQILIVGEALLDQFPDGTSVVGGAPLNVAWHLHGLGSDPCFVSAVGDDALGERLCDAISKWGMSTDHIQVVDTKSTGVVRVTLKDGQPSYEIVRDVAYDHLQFPADLAEKRPRQSENDQQADGGCRLLYHGSLCFRSEQTKQTIVRLKQELRRRVFVDINLREDHFDPSWLPDVLAHADYLKCNEDELQCLAGQKLDGDADVIPLAQRLISEHGLRACWITMGDRGAHWVDQHGEHAFVKTPAVDEVDFRDTIGAGDAFTAITLRGLAQGHDMTETLQNAVRFAAKVCTLSGATTSDKSFYSDV